MRVLDLFSGVGMFAYGMEKAGHEVVAFCEIEEWPRKVLSKNFPGVPQYKDVRELNHERLEEDGVLDPAGVRLQGRNQQEVGAGCDRQDGRTNELAGTNGCIETRFGVGQETGRSIDIITGGFPCQDLSVAGKQAGIHGERSGLFDEIIRLACELRPRYIVLENVAALLTGDSGGWARYVFGQLAEIGFDAEWHVIPAGSPDGLSAGAPHRRERVWIVAYPKCKPGKQVIQNSTGSNQRGSEREECRPVSRGESQDVAYAGGEGSQGSSTGRVLQGREVTNGHGGQGGTRNGRGQPERPTQPGLGLLANGITAGLAGLGWLPEPGIGRVATGVPDRVQKLKALGNGLVWQIPYAIGRAILEAEA